MTLPRGGNATRLTLVTEDRGSPLSVEAAQEEIRTASHRLSGRRHRESKADLLVPFLVVAPLGWKAGKIPRAGSRQTPLNLVPHRQPEPILVPPVREFRKRLTKPAIPSEISDRAVPRGSIFGHGIVVSRLAGIGQFRAATVI